MATFFFELCSTFTRARGREDVANACQTLIEFLQKVLKDGGARGEDSAETCLSLFSVVAKCRLEAVEQTLSRVKDFMRCDSLSLLDADQWDPLCMLLFVCECQCRAALLDNATVALREDLRDGVSAAVSEEMNRMRRELDEGVRILKPTEYVAEGKAAHAYGMSLCVCFDKPLLYDDDAPYARHSCITRKGIRLLERHCLIENFENIIAQTMDRLPVEELPRDEEEEACFSSWVRRNITLDSNNALLLRLDEWALCCMLTAGDIVRASGERGGVPQEYRNTPAAWVCRESRPDDVYREMMLKSKKNEIHPENAYVCFSALLEQNYNFDWMQRCFVSRLSPEKALKKIRKYLACGNSKTPPLVVQTEEGTARVVWRTGCVVVSSPVEAVCAWLRVTKQKTGGLFTRKADVSSVWDRLRQTREEILEEEMNVPPDRIVLPDL